MWSLVVDFILLVEFFVDLISESVLTNMFLATLSFDSPGKYTPGLMKT